MALYLVHPLVGFLSKLEVYSRLYLWLSSRYSLIFSQSVLQLLRPPFWIWKTTCCSGACSEVVKPRHEPRVRESNESHVMTVITKSPLGWIQFHALMRGKLLVNFHLLGVVPGGYRPIAWEQALLWGTFVLREKKMRKRIEPRAVWVGGRTRFAPDIFC